MLGEIATAAGVPVAIVDIADSTLKQAFDSPGSSESRRVNAVSQGVIDTQAPVIIPNVAESKSFANDPFLLENGIRFYAGVPLLGPDGKVIGALGLLDHKSKPFTEAELEALELQALRLMLALTQMREPAMPQALQPTG